jgi:hypothetical protein
VFASQTLVLHATGASSCLLGPLLLRVQVAVQKPGRFLLGAGHQVPVAVHGDRDARVTHERGQRLGVDTGRDHQAGEGVAALVGSDPLHARFGPYGVGAVLEVLAVEGIRRRSAEEQLVSLAARGQLVLDQVVAQLQRDRHPAASARR